jgi:hypothetical protein
MATLIGVLILWVIPAVIFFGKQSRDKAFHAYMEKRGAKQKRPSFYRWWKISRYFGAAAYVAVVMVLWRLFSGPTGLSFMGIPILWMAGTATAMFVQMASLGVMDMEMFSGIKSGVRITEATNAYEIPGIPLVPQNEHGDSVFENAGQNDMAEADGAKASWIKEVKK